jgi:hypothetical protein
MVDHVGVAKTVRTAFAVITELPSVAFTVYAFVPAVIVPLDSKPVLAPIDTWLMFTCHVSASESASVAVSCCDHASLTYTVLLVGTCVNTGTEFEIVIVEELYSDQSLELYALTVQFHTLPLVVLPLPNVVISVLVLLLIVVLPANFCTVPLYQKNSTIIVALLSSKAVTLQVKSLALYAVAGAISGVDIVIATTAHDNIITIANNTQIMLVFILSPLLSDEVTYCCPYNQKYQPVVC